jgi:hypothetical protein
LLDPSTTPDSVTVDPSTDEIFVATFNGLFKIDGSTNVATADGGIFDNLDGAVAVNQATGFPYTADPLSGAYDLRPGGSELSVNINPISVAPGNGAFFVSNCLAGFFSAVWEFDASTDKQPQQNGAPWLCPEAIAVRGSTVFAVNNGNLAILNVAQDAVTGAFSEVRRRRSPLPPASRQRLVSTEPHSGCRPARTRHPLTPRPASCRPASA